MFKRMKKIPNTYLKVSLVILIASYFVITCLFRYVDTTSFTVWSVNFWDLLFQGRLGDFYSYSMDNLRQAPHDLFCGSYLTIFPWILWNFPLYLTHRFPDNILVDSFACIIWSKLLLLICVAGVAFYSYKIVKNVIKGDDEQAWLAAILAVGGYEIINSTAYAGQDEIIYVACMMAALYYLLLGKKKAFWICSCMAVTICPIMLVPFLAAYLIYEKNIFKILGGTVLVLLPSVLFEMIYRNDALYQQNKGPNTVLIFQSMMNGDMIGTALGTASMVGIALIFAFFVCYITNKEEDDKPLFLIYMLAAVFFVICFMAPFNVFYRFGIYAPFWAIWLVIYKDKLNMNLFLLIILSYGRAFLSLGYTLASDAVLTQNWNSQFLMPEILSVLEGKIRIRATVEMAVNLLGNIYHSALGMVRTIVFAAAVILMAINWKGWKAKVNINIPYKISTILYVSSTALFALAFAVCILT